MRVSVGICLVVGLIALAVPKHAEAMQVRLLDQSLSMNLNGVMSPSAAADNLKLSLDDGSGGGASMSPWIPWIASFIIPGLGQVINGQILKGVAFFLGDGLLFGIGEGLVAPGADGTAISPVAGLVFELAGTVVWVWNWWDAYATAKAAGGGDDVAMPAPVIVTPSVDSAVDVSMRRSHALAPAMQASLYAFRF